MKEILIILLVISIFSSCNKIENENLKVSNKIKKIAVSTYGGMTGVSDDYIFTKDSIHHEFYLAADTSQNKKELIANKEFQWKRMTNIIKLSKFKLITDGVSNQPVDGTDVTISVTTENGKKYNATNGEKNKDWKDIYVEFKKQIKK